MYIFLCPHTAFSMLPVSALHVSPCCPTPFLPLGSPSSSSSMDTPKRYNDSIDSTMRLL